MLLSHKKNIVQKHSLSPPFGPADKVYTFICLFWVQQQPPTNHQVSLPASQTSRHLSIHPGSSIRTYIFSLKVLTIRLEIDICEKNSVICRQKERKAGHVVLLFWRVPFKIIEKSNKNLKLN